MKRTIQAVIATAAILLSGLAHAEVVHKGRVVPTTADRYIAQEQLACTYGQWRSEILPNGATVLIRSKSCKGESR